MNACSKNSYLSRLYTGLVLSLFIALLPTTVVHAGPGDGRNSLQVDGTKRSYLLRIPERALKRNSKIPLVLVLHGGGGNGAGAEKMTGFTAKAKAEGFIVAYPDGSGRLKRRVLTWNAGHCCGLAMDKQVDDVAFISALLDELLAEYPIDPSRIYVTGMSNGGMMSHRLGIELSDRFAAIAPVVSGLFGDESAPAQPVSAIMINGVLDESVPVKGGPPGGRFADEWDGTPIVSALDQARFWADANQCKKRANRDNSGELAVLRYQCPENSAVELYLVKDNAHAWPGGKKGSIHGDRPSTTINATDVIWSFFSDHSRN